MCSHGIQIPNRELAQRILAGAFRDPYQPTPALAQALRQALSLNNSSSVSEESESFDDSLHRGKCAECPTEVLVKEVLKSANVVDFRPSVQVLEPKSKPPQETEPVHHSSSPPHSAAVNSAAVAEAMNRSVTSEPDPVVMKVDVVDTDRHNAELSKNVVPGSTKFPAGFDFREGEKSIDDLRQTKAESKNHNERWWVTLSVVGGCSVFLVLLIAIIATLKNQKRNEDTSRSYTPYSNGTATRGLKDEAQQTASEFAKITPTILDTDAQQQIINKWITENHSKLFTDTGALTSFGDLYQQFEIAIDEQTPNVTLLERHQEVLKRIAIAEQSPSLSGEWETSNGQLLKLTESGNTVTLQLLRSSTMSSATGVLQRHGKLLSGTLSGTFYSGPSGTKNSTFEGEVINMDRIDYTVDVLTYDYGPRSIPTREATKRFMRRASKRPLFQ